MRSSRKDNLDLVEIFAVEFGVGQQLAVAHHVVDGFRMQHEIALLAELGEFGKISRFSMFTAALICVVKGLRLVNTKSRFSIIFGRPSTPRRLANRLDVQGVDGNFQHVEARNARPHIF